MNDNDIKLPPLPEGYDKYDPPLLYDGQMFVEGQMRSYAREAVRLNACESRAITHADDCWSWGHGHYKCAVREIDRMRTENERLREVLEDIRGRSSMNLAMNPNPFALTARLGDIYQIADAALGHEPKNKDSE